MKIGIYNPYLETKGGGEKVCLALAEHFAKDSRNTVFIIGHDKIDLKELGEYFDLDLRRVQTLIIKTNNILLKLWSKLPLPSMARSFPFDLVRLRKLRKQKFDLFVNNVVFSNMAAPIENSVYLCMFPQKIDSKDKNISFAKRAYMMLMNNLYRLSMHPSKKFGVQTYKKVIANSEFTKNHIKRLWNLDSEILYPICDDMSSPNIAKEKIILNVGRFFARDSGNHHKRQDMLLEEFAKLKSLHKAGWQLHFAGSVAEDNKTLKYIIGLTQRAKRSPIHFHFNCSFSELKELFNKATIYWHATGYGSDESRFPERQEHFGITTVEAMSTGAVPVVINSAGQKESVDQGKNGYLWQTPRELEQFTKQLANMDKERLGQLQAAATAKAKQFNKDAFSKRVDDILGSLIS